ncbi:MAG: hypothetical protein IPN96_02275 [Anaerolineales bacterium]|nr:hypothetical protein [Anaerolineales bacterium]
MYRKPLLFLIILILISACGNSSKPKVVTAAGDIASAVDEYRALLGENNGGDPGTKGPTGYREINWDSLSDERAAPNFYVSDFFNGAEAPQARGIVLNTPAGLMVAGQ